MTSQHSGITDEGSDQWDETTAPDGPSAVTNRALLKSLQSLERTVRAGFRWLAVSVGALALVTALLWLLR